jgi:hypothetical protein
MEKVWLLWHTHPGGEDDENAKLIGVYASEVDALAAKDRGKDQPGFVDWPEGFFAEAYEVGKDHWEEGFITCAEAHDASPREHEKIPDAISREKPMGSARQHR